MRMMHADYIQLVECPRDAMQGWPRPISTEQKIQYLNCLIGVGFHTLDFGSFVSPKAIPQMADTKEVLKGLTTDLGNTKLLAIVANLRGAQEAAAYEMIRYLGFPFSISPTFQRKNANSTIEESLDTVRAIRDVCANTGKELVVYISMGFGNPYGDDYSVDIVQEWVGKLVNEGIKIISLADTVGVATPEQISGALLTLIPAHPDTAIGVHLHATPDGWKEKLSAAVDAGCMRIDGAIMGIGGCPMAEKDLVGNMDTRNIIEYLKEKNLLPSINSSAFQQSVEMAKEVFR